MPHASFDGTGPSLVTHIAKLEKITFPEQSSHYDLAPCAVRVYDFALRPVERLNRSIELGKTGGRRTTTTTIYNEISNHTLTP